MNSNDVHIEKLVELGADKLGSMLESLQRKDHEAAHYYKGGVQALKEATFNLFGIDGWNYRADCMAVVTARQEAGEVSAYE